MIDLYEPLLGKVLFPAFEAARGRPTIPLRNRLERTQWWSLPRLRDLQSEELRALVRHAYDHTAYYRRVLDERGLSPAAISDVGSLAQLPLLDRTTARETLEQRTASNTAV